MRKIKVISKRPGCPPRMVNISNRLENLQDAVGGYIESVTLARDLTVICDEEGRLKNKPHNCRIANISFVGDIIICGVKGDELADVPMTMQELKRFFPELWEGLE